MKRHLKIIILSILIIGIINFQMPYGIEKTKGMINSQEMVKQDWSMTLGGIKDDIGSIIIKTSEGGYALVGSTESYGKGGYDIWLLKLDNNWNVEWNKTIGGIENDFSNNFIQTFDGGYIIIGQTESYGAGNSDIWVVKTDSNGNLEWNQTFGGAENDYGSALLQSSDSDFIVAGNVLFNWTSKFDAFLVKINLTGHVEWNRTIGGSENDRVIDLIQTSDNGLALVGETWISGQNNDDIWLVKTDITGNEQWNRTYEIQFHETGYALTQDTDGGFVIAGLARYPNYPNSADMFLLKMDSSGLIEWSHTYGGNKVEGFNSFLRTSDDGFLLTGHTTSYGAGGFDIWLVKTNVSGHTEWNTTFGGNMSDFASIALQTSDGGILLTGHTYSYGAGGSDIWIVKTSTIQPKISPFINPTFIILVVLVLLTKRRKKYLNINSM